MSNRSDLGGVLKEDGKSEFVGKSSLRQALSRSYLDGSFRYVLLMENRSATRLIGFVGFEGITALDLVGPLEAFSCAAGPDRSRYQCRIYGVTRQPFAAESGVVIAPHACLDEAPRIDTLIIPGGCGLRKRSINERIVGWIRSRAASTRRVASVCTGIYGLAPTGLLDGRRVTTHWQFANDVAARFPSLRVEADHLFIQDGKYFTTAGVTAGIDLALALIEADYDSHLAVSVARELVVYLKRNGGQSQYSEPLQLQSSSPTSLRDITSWIAGRLHKPISVESLARRANLSVRQLHRRFRTVFGTTPTVLIERLRMDVARNRLREGRHSIDRIAEATGYRSADVFRRAFVRQFGVTPRDYRRRFLESGNVAK
jgi:transcriptional regulator GlxA family with amidase domain